MRASFREPGETNSKQSPSQEQQQQHHQSLAARIQKLASTSVAPLAAMAVLLSPGAFMNDGGAAYAGLPGADPVKDGRILLRNALPINGKNPIRVVQRELESINEALRVPGVKFSAVNSAVKRSQSIVSSSKKREAILSDVNPDRRAAAEMRLDAIQRDLSDFETIVDNKDKQEVPVIQQKILAQVGEVEEDMVSGFPFEIPTDYAQLPQLKGRATLEMKLRFANPVSRSLEFDRATLKIVVDGYNAPISAGNFVDLVMRKFYDDMEIQRSDGFVVQTGDPQGQATGFVDPGSGEVRRIPFEVMVEKQNMPVYEETLEELGRFNEQPVLPFNAFGTMAWARSEFEPNSASSQFFFLLRDSELTPSGSNLLDGQYAVFGYVTEGKDYLESLQVGDKIESVKVLDGADNLVRKQQEPPPAAEPAASSEPTAADATNVA